MKPDESPHDTGENISLDEIKGHIEEGKIEEGLRLAKLRLAGLRGALLEIRDALATSHEIDPGVWQEERAAYQHEIDELEKIVARYGQ